MKKMIFIVLTILLCGCIPSSPTDKSGRLVAEQDKNNKNVFIIENNGMKIMFRYIIIDKHEYIISIYDRGIGLTHSPKCQCNKR